MGGDPSDGGTGVTEPYHDPLPHAARRAATHP